MGGATPRIDGTAKMEAKIGNMCEIIYPVLLNNDTK